MRKHLIIDGNAVGYLMNAGKELSSPLGEPVQAVYGFINFIERCRRDYPDYGILILWDSPSNWRFDEVDGYKETRKKSTDPAFIKLRETYKTQKPIIRAALQNLNVCQVEVPGYEADDIAGFLSASAEKLNQYFILMTSDSDWYQCVSDRVSLYNIRKHLTVNIDNFYDVTGYRTPKMFIEAKAMIGDTSDDIKGVKGIGEKTAQKIFGEQPCYDQYRDLVKEGHVSMDTLPKAIRSLICGEFVPLEHEDKERFDVFQRNRRVMDFDKSPVMQNESMVIGHIVGSRPTANKEGFREFCKRYGFNSMLLSFDRKFQQISGVTHE